MILPYIPYVLALVLIAAMIIEMRTGKIPNWLTLVPFALFIVVAAMAEDRTALAWQLALAAGVFAVGLLLFAFAGFGAGAVKLMAGLALFVPLDEAFYAFLIFMATLFVGVLLVIMLRNTVGSEDSKWHMLSKNVMPMTLPIAAAGLAVFFWL